MNILKYIISILAFVSSPVFASGVFDFLDSCIAAKEDYWDARHEIMKSVDSQISAIPNEPASTEFVVLWWEEKEKILRKSYDDLYSQVVKDAGGNVEEGYKRWLANVIEEGGGAENIKTTVIDAEFRRIKTLKARQERGDLVADLDKQKNELYDDCPSDVANQVFRGTITVITAPIGWTSSNFESAKNESGELSKVSKALTGVSLDDIAKDGVLGGEHSEARKAANAIAGGKNSEVRKTLRALDPSGWKL
ncbi:hypothetical protein [Vibrio parahaemolyticus]|uniref:hypothetical protein n=1 Tax=Vibrio parahaemolyticus TaxID=670 RepID=UPI00215BBEBA|nr:hypothetical protein [Vibrio parahaemolyticus]EJB8506205.1 hypothetical protein [Vibrio parahaemolyticus]MCR9864622.1 hypothetical protein [Vibrio parahaemolyticus]